MSTTRLTLFAVAVTGLLVSGYLFVTYTANLPIRCGADGGCEVIRQSPYASFFGIPTPAYGLVYYGLLALGALLLASPQVPLVTRGLQLLTLSGVAVSLYLTYLEVYVIEAWCRWCVVSALLTIAALAVVWAPALHSRATSTTDSTYDE